ncbi:MAG: ABC transporter permease, partial [candidate division WOR-3 bacterium]
MKILKIAWRNVFRHTRRTIITALAISIGLGAMIYLDTMMNGVDKMASRNIIDFETSHLVVFAQGYYKEENFYPLDTIIENFEGVMKQLLDIKEIRTATPRIKFQCRINNGIEELPVLGIGIELERDTEVFEIHKSIIKGSYLKTEDEVLIGSDLARDMNLDVGSHLTVITRDRNDTYNAFDFIVSGLLSTGHPLFDRNAIIMPLETAQHLLAMEDCATEICIRLEG